MNYRVLQRLFCLSVAITGSIISVSFVAPSKASAETELVLPATYMHEGLSFESGLSFTKATEVKKINIVFEALSELEETKEVSITEPEAELFVQATKDIEVLAEEIVLPTPKKEKITPTATPTITPTKKITPTTTEKTVLTAVTMAPTETVATPTSSEALTTPTATSLPAYATNGTLNADTLFSMVNQKRADAGLPAFEKHPDVCAVAESRKPEIENEVYGSSSIHAGFRARNLPFRASENMISQGSEEAALNWWMNSSIHRAGILGSSKYACLVCQNKTCAMIMSSLEPK